MLTWFSLLFEASSATKLMATIPLRASSRASYGPLDRQNGSIAQPRRYLHTP